MNILLILSFIIGTLIINTLAAFQFVPYPYSYLVFLHTVLTGGAIYTLVTNFRRGRTTDYRKGFNAFGMTILLTVPMLFSLIPNVWFVITGNDWSFYVGLILYGISFLAILFGILVGRWNWKVHHVELEVEGLDDDLDGVKLVQISDVHIGSFFNLHHKVEPAIQKINALGADFVFFTGDLVNNIADEMLGWEPLFSKIEAKRGKYSILGNHDYGDYVKWDADHQKHSNLHQLIQTHRSIGFTPLLNDHVQLSENTWLLGVENWGKPPFRQSGELQQVLDKTPQDAVKILLSHDPSHFDEQVVGQNIFLTLSGHTHGMQFGIERFGIKWSPVSFKYKKWAGLYEVNNQYLYVNRGFGYLGFPGRVGIYPEITSIVLKQKKSN